MPIHVRLEDYHGNAIADLISPMWLTNAWLTNWLVQLPEIEQTVCLRFIDLYGDTVFNQAQVRTLIEELTAIADALTNEAIDRTYERWLARFEAFDSSIREEARRHPKPTRTALLTHIQAIKELALLGLASSHRYLRFVGD